MGFLMKKVTLFMGLVLMATNSGAANRDTHQTNAPPGKPSMGALDNMPYANTYVIEPSNCNWLVNPYECTDVTSGITLKVNNDCIVPMRPVMDKHHTKYKPYKLITWPDSKRYIKWLLRPQCTSKH